MTYNVFGGTLGLTQSINQSSSVFQFIQSTTGICFYEHVVNVWNSLAGLVNFSALNAFKPSIKVVNSSEFFRCSWLLLSWRAAMHGETV